MSEARSTPITPDDCVAAGRGSENGADTGLVERCQKGYDEPIRTLDRAAQARSRWRYLPAPPRPRLPR